MMTMITRFNLRQPLVLSLVFFAALTAASYGLGTDPTVNLWSLRYLWAESGTQANALSAHPISSSTPPSSHINSYIWQARAALQHGEPMRALQVLHPALAMGSNNAQRLLAEIYIAQGKYAEAINIWVTQADVDSLLAAGRKATEEQRTNEALTAYTAAYQIAPERTVLPFARFLWKNGNNASAAETLLHEYITSWPGSRYYVQWLSELASLYHAEGALDKSVTIYEQLLAAAPDRASDWIELGWTYYERGDGDDVAIELFQRAVDLNPRKGIGYYAVATLLSQEGKWQAADTWYAEALNREPSQRWWWLMRGQTALQAGNLTLAVQLYSIAQKRFPTDAVTHIQAATAYQKNNDRQAMLSALAQAEAHFDETLTAATRSQQIRNADYLVRMGELYTWGNDYMAATRVYQAALRIDPQHADAARQLQALTSN